MSTESVMLSNHLLLPSIFPSIRVFSNELVLASGSQNIRASASASVLPMNVQGWFHLGLTGLVSLQSKGLSRIFSSTHNSKSINSSVLRLLHDPTLTSIHDHWKNHNFDYIWTFVSKVIFLLFNMLTRFVIAFLPRSKSLLISWLQSLTTGILEPKKIKSVTASTFYPSIFYWAGALECGNCKYWAHAPQLSKPVGLTACAPPPTCSKRVAPALCNHRTSLTARITQHRQK